MGEIIIQKQQGGLGVLPLSEDHISGLLFYHPAPGSLEGIHNLYSAVDADTLGIPTDKSDETKATGGNVQITATGLDGGSHTVTMAGVELGSVVFSTGDTLADIADALADDITANSSTTGYTATAVGAVISLVGPDGIGSYMNTGLSYAATNGGTATVTQFSGGIDAVFDVLHYHITEFFRANKDAQLVLAIYQSPVSLTFEELLEVQLAADGKIKQFAVYTANLAAFTTAQVVSLQAIMVDLEDVHTPAIAILGPDTSQISLSALADLRALTAPAVSVIIGQDGAASGSALAAIKPYSVTALGCLLGQISRSNVSECIGWVGKYNLAEIELDVPAFGNKALFKNQSESLISAIDLKGYIFIRKYVGNTGSFFNDSHSCVAYTNDFSSIERNRTMNKAIRSVRTALLPEINGKIRVDVATGKIDPTSAKYLESLGNTALEAMQRNEEISGASTFVDPNQNVIATNQVVIVIRNVPFAISRQFVVKIGFTTQL